MDLKEQWKKWSDEQVQQPAPTAAQIEQAMKEKSVLPLAKVKRGLLIKLGFAVAINLAFIALLVITPQVEIKVLLGILVLAYSVGSVWIWVNYKKLQAHFPAEQSVKETIEFNLDRIRQAIRLETNVALILYPVAITAGFMLGFSSEVPLDRMFEEKIVLYALFGVIVVCTPLSHWFGKWMSRKAFGKQISQLEANLEALQAAE